MVQQNEEMYRKRAEEFVRDARMGRLDKLMRYTSKLTIQIHSKDKIRSGYDERVIPAFRNSKVVWDRDAVQVFDSRRNPGFSFSGTIVKGYKKRFQIVVFGEDGEYVIANISSKDH